MKFKGKHGRSYFVAGVLLLAFGIYFAVYSSAIPPHLKVYFVVGSDNVKTIEISPEYAIPLAGVQPYIQNLTMGSRTLELTATYNGKLLLNQTLPSVGTGYQVWRTNTLDLNPPANSTVQVSLKLIRGTTLIGESMSDVTWSQDYFYLIGGILMVLLGLGMSVSRVWRGNPKVREARRGVERRRQNHAVVEER